MLRTQLLLMKEYKRQLTWDSSGSRQLVKKVTLFLNICLNPSGFVRLYNLNKNKGA